MLDVRMSVFIEHLSNPGGELAPQAIGIEY